jgi:excisionase family DNA binding protein
MKTEKKQARGDGQRKETIRQAISDATAGREDLLDMEQAIALLKTTRPTFYRWLRSGKLRGMKVGRQWRFYRADVEGFMKGEEPRIALPADIAPFIRDLEKKLVELGGKSPPDDGELPVVRAVSLMVLVASVMKASDLHLTAHTEPGRVENVGVFRCRVDGVLQVVVTFDIRLLPALVERWKIMANCALHVNDKPQDGRVMIQVGGQPLDLRVNFLPAITGEAVTARVLERARVVLDLAQMAYAPRDRAKNLQALKAPAGMVVVTGPVGCGKTTTLYACLNQLGGPHSKIVTVEDPVEYVLPWATQIRIRPESGVTFTNALRAVQRSDPDVIMIGEIRDRDTLQIAQQAALTGHLVLTTLHTNDAADALKRMLDIGSEPFIIAESTRLIVAQRLIRRLCPECAVAAAPMPDQVELLDRLGREHGFDWHALGNNFRKPVGCPACARTGFCGRHVIAEALEVTPEIGRLLRDKSPADVIRQKAVEQGMTTMMAHGVQRAARGETSLTEVFCVLASFLG